MTKAGKRAGPRMLDRGVGRWFVGKLDPHLVARAVLEDRGYSLAVRRRNALEITETDDRLIAAAAIIGDRSVPVIG